MACASTPRVFESRFTQEYFPSSDGTFRFKLPAGWINATTDSPSVNTVVWLVRSDFAAMLVVREVVIDSVTRWDIRKSGLGRLGDLMLALARSESGASIVKQPQRSSVAGGIDGCTYEYIAGHPGDRVHVVLVSTGSRVYEVSSRMKESMDEEASDGIISLQEAFVRNVLW